MQPTSYNPNGRREIKQAISTQQYFYLKTRLQSIMHIPHWRHIPSMKAHLIRQTFLQEYKH